MRRKSISAEQYRVSIRNAILTEDICTFVILLNESTNNIHVMRALRQVIIDLECNGYKSKAETAIMKCSDFTATPEYNQWRVIPYSPSGATDALINLFYQYCDRIIAGLQQTVSSAALFSPANKM